jgi:hypothetical protein
MYTRAMLATRGFCAMLVLSVVAAAAQAAPIADGFLTTSGNYTVGALSGQNPYVPFFTSGWTQGTGSTRFSVISTGLTSTAATYKTGGAVELTGATADTSQSIGRNVTIPTASTYYMSVLVDRGNSASITPGSYALMGFGNSVQPDIVNSGSTLQGVYIGYTQSAATTSGGTLDDFGSLVIRSRQNIAGANRVVDTVLVDGQAFSTFQQTYLVVAKLNVNSTGTTDLLTYWVNPTSLSSEATMSSTALITGSVPVSTIATAADLSRLTLAEDSYNATIDFDEPRIGTTLAELAAATPTPEPSALVFAALAFTALRSRSRRSRLA